MTGILPEITASPFIQNPWKLFRNTTAETIPPFSILRITGTENFNGGIRFTVAKPNATQATAYMVNGPYAVPAGYDGICTTLTQAGYVAYDSGDGTPALGESWGAKNGQWTAEKGVQGFFVCGGVKSTAGVNAVAAIQISSSTPEIKIIRHGWLPAAYGGASTTGISGATATANGNLTPSNRMIFPKLWTNSYSINSGGDFEANSETGYCVNLGSLPIHTGWSLAAKLPTTHPAFGTLWAILPDAPSHYGTADFTWDEEPGSGDWTYEDGDKKLIRPGSGSAASSAVTTLWAFPWGGDVMLSHVGLYEVTFGYQGRVSTTTPPYYEIETSDASAGTSHTHTFDRPAGFSVEFGIHQNFRPGVSVIGTNPNDDHLMRNHHIAHSFAVESYEKTVLVKTESSPWHGQHHTRLSLYIDILLDSGSSSAGTPSFILDRAWLNVRPARGNSSSESSATDFFGAGANQYPGGYLDGLGTFVWYGGGSEPDEIDEDGAVIP